LNRRLIGYVLHHADVSAVDFVRRAAMVGISNGNTHSDKEIVYVGRYDWVRDKSLVNWFVLNQTLICSPGFMEGGQLSMLRWVPAARIKLQTSTNLWAAG
jgi:hypothetical protein